MPSILAYVDLTLAGYVAVFVATLVFSQKIKDFFAGVPADMRTGLKSVETSLLADVKTYQASLIQKLAPVPTPVVAAAPTPVVAAAPTPPAA
jgi:hypothetical protein